MIKKSLTFEDYKKCLFSEEKVLKEMNIIRSKNHDIYSMNVNKYDTHEADKIELKISDKTLNFYDNWYETYQKIQ